MQSITYKPGFGEVVEGEVLLAKEAFSPRYDLDRDTGILSRKGYSVEGHSIKDKVFIVKTSKGGVAAGWAFYDLKKRGLAPKALLCTTTNPVFVQGCVFAGISILHEPSKNPAEVLKTGDRVHIDPTTGIVSKLKN